MRAPGGVFLLIWTPWAFRERTGVDKLFGNGSLLSSTRCVKGFVMPAPASPSTVTKPTTVKATERRQQHHPGFDLRFSKKEDHFAALSRALLDMQPEQDAEHRSVGRIAAYLIFAILILGIGIGAYAYATGQIELPSLTRLLERGLNWTQRLLERVLDWTQRLRSSGWR